MIQKDKNLLGVLCTISLFVCFSDVVQGKNVAFKTSFSASLPAIHDYNLLLDEDKLALINNKKHFMVVFVHGTILPIPSFNVLWDAAWEFFSTPHAFRKSFYNCYLDALKFKSMYRHQPIGDIGLHEVAHQNLEFKGSYACWKATDIYEKMYRSCVPSDAYSNFAFYTFGWEGVLNKQSRKKWAEVFYHALSAEIDRRKKNFQADDALEVIVVAHSHGGNVALHLADAEEKIKKNLLIDKLVLLGIPVQSETSACIQSPLFKKIYNIYSRGDFIQIMDVISSRDVQPRRRFDKEKGCIPLPKKLVQVEVEVGSKKPSHIELWAFGGEDNIFYRKHLPIYPLPVFVFMPVVLAGIDHHMLGVGNIHLNIEQKNEGYHFVFRSYDDKLEDQTVSKPRDYALFVNFDNIRDQISMILRE